MHSTYPNEPSTQSLGTKRIRLTSFDRLWANLLPPEIKTFLPKWPVSMGIFALMGICTQSQFLITANLLLWASMFAAFVFAKLRQYLGNSPWILTLYHAGLATLVATPAFAQATGGACSSSGLFAGVTNFISSLFASVTFGGIGGGTLSTLICQVVGFLTISLLLGFLGVLGYIAFQIGYQRQPISTVLDPLMGFLIFAGGATIIIGVMVGTGTTT
ncbi:hypothetical protein [Chroococcus sp. FPU101]|uniref:hypothetical protein n=1 Tax=Chroococcus sp. FPU101 TaxID=1974212 RepID=UPI001A8D301F|nr:hypothetical protein [Chroococcus sp. FPU101]GFE72153.1 hypothetical protein CFPU101_47630 [Chroococcus sp. FPU101]